MVSRLRRTFAVAIKHRIQDKSNNIYICIDAFLLACMLACIHVMIDESFHFISVKRYQGQCCALNNLNDEPMNIFFRFKR